MKKFKSAIKKAIKPKKEEQSAGNAEFLAPLTLKIDSSGKLSTNVPSELQELVGQKEFNNLCKMMSYIALMEMEEGKRVLH